MANTTDFISAVYDELAKLLGGDLGPSSLMQMAWPGYALSPADFKRSEAPGGPYDPEVAKETFSALANIAPALGRARFENSGFEVDDIYDIVLSSAIPVGATQETVATNPIYRLFSDAQYELMQARRGLHDDPNGFYYPCSATPVNWYDEGSTQGWTTITLQQTDVKPATPAFAKAGGLDLAKSGVWRLKPAATEVAAIKTRILSVMAPRAAMLDKAAAAQPAVASPKITSSMLRKPAAVDAARSMMGARMPVAAKPASPQLGGIDPAKVSRLFSPVSAPTKALSRPAVDVSRIDLAKRDLGVDRLAERLRLKDLLDKQLPSKPPSPATDGYSISFKVCRVSIERPWLKLALLSTKNWWMFGTPAGMYSTGTAENNAGMFPLLTTSLIVIRDLKITANWSQEDRQNLANAASFGFFDVRNGTLNSNTLEVKGMQVIGWISRLTPMLPPLSPQ